MVFVLHCNKFIENPSPTCYKTGLRLTHVYLFKPCGWIKSNLFRVNLKKIESYA